MSDLLPDVQNEIDTRGKRIDWVGIEDYRIPFKVKTKDGGTLTTVGSITMMTSLSSEIKGANMSRYGRIIEKALIKDLVSTDLLVDMLRACRDVLEAENSYIILGFPYFIKKTSPVAKKISHMTYDCNFCGVLENGVPKIYLEVSVPYTSLCPCSQEISKYGAHNQPSKAIVRVKFKNGDPHIWIEDLVSLVEEQASCEIYNVLKREDEKYVTERAYENPKFVEDMIRDISIKLDDISSISGYRIKIEHYESIHQHKAIAKMKKNL